MLYRHLVLWAVLFMSPMLIANEQMSYAEDSEIASDVRIILKDLDELQKARKSGEIEWEWKLIEAIDLGYAAVPELVKQLDATPTDERLMLRTIPFILRGIGDRRAIPGLIRAIPKCYGKDGSDMGYRCDDPELLKLLQKYDNSEKDDDGYNYGRPINEVFRTLEKWAGEDHGWAELAFVSEQGTPRQKQLKSQLFEQQARRWEKWWLGNWQTFTDDANYSRVDLPAFQERENVEYEFDRKKPLNRYSGQGESALASIHDADRESNWARDFYDLDTGRRSHLPEKWRQQSPVEELRAAHADIRKWASDNGFDMFGTTITHDGREYYVIETVDMEVWEVPESMNKFDKQRSANDFIEAGRKSDRYFACFDQEQNDYDHSQQGSFFYITREGTPGLLSLGEEVSNSDATPTRPADRDSHRKRAKYYEGRQYSLDLAE